MIYRDNRVIMLLAQTYVIDQRVRREAEALAMNGLKITVLSWDRGGKQSRHEEHQGIRVISYKLLSGLEFSKLRFALSAVIFQVICFAWCLRHCKDYGIIHAHDFNTLLGAAVLKLVCLGRKNLVYDSHEFTPGAYSEWYGRNIGALSRVLERELVRQADAIITVSPPIQRYLSSISQAPTFVIYNSVRVSEVPAESKSALREMLKVDGFVVSYVGGVREDVALDEFVETARYFKSTPMHSFRFLIVGDGSELAKLRSKSSDIGDQLSFIPRVSHDEAMRYVKASDISYAVYKGGGDNARIAMPWKVFEAMACGTPILVRGDTYTWQFVKSLGVGFSAGSSTPNEIAKEIRWAFEHQNSLSSMSEEGKKNFISKLNWDNMAQTLIEIYQNLPSR